MRIDDDFVFITICKSFTMFFLLVFSLGLAGIYLITHFKFDSKKISFIKSFSLGIFLAYSLMTLLRDADAIFKSEYEKEQTLNKDAVFYYHNDEEYKRKNFPYAYFTCFLSITLNFMLEKMFFTPKIRWMKKAKQPWEIDNTNIQFEKKMSIFDAKDWDAQNILERESQINQIKEKLHQKLHESIKSEQIFVESIEEIKEKLEIGSYDNLDSEDYTDILEYKFKKTIGVFSVFIQSLKFLRSKKLNAKPLILYNKMNLKIAGLAFFLGICVGLQREINNFISILIGVTTYTLIQAIELGSIFQGHSHSRRKYLLIIFIYSIIVPFGMGFGWILESLKDRVIFQAVFLALCAGNLLFITIFKGFVEEFFVSKLKVMKAIGVCLGVLTVIVFNLNELNS